MLLTFRRRSRRGSRCQTRCPSERRASRQTRRSRTASSPSWETLRVLGVKDIFKVPSLQQSWGQKGILDTIVAGSTICWQSCYGDSFCFKKYPLILKIIGSRDTIAYSDTDLFSQHCHWVTVTSRACRHTRKIPRLCIGKYKLLKRLCLWEIKPCACLFLCLWNCRRIGRSSFALRNLTDPDLGRTKTFCVCALVF